jgi:hypothetical protein
MKIRFLSVEILKSIYIFFDKVFFSENYLLENFFFRRFEISHGEFINKVCTHAKDMYKETSS